MRTKFKGVTFPISENKADSQQNGELVTRSPDRPHSESAYFQCRDCQKKLSMDFLSKGRKNWCKICYNVYVKQWRANHPNKVKEYRDKRAEQQRTYYRHWYASNGRQRASDYLAKSKEYIKSHRKEVNVSQRTRRAIQRGELTKPIHCEKCNKRRKVVAHHDDYSRPFDVLWLCHSCHKKLHLGLL